MHAVENTNPDGKNPIEVEGNRYMLKPRQCFRCMNIFTPENEIERHCSSCKASPRSEDRLMECRAEGCENVIKVSAENGSCKEHQPQKEDILVECTRKNCGEPAIKNAKSNLCVKHYEEGAQKKRDWYEKRLKEQGKTVHPARCSRVLKAAGVKKQGVPDIPKKIPPPARRKNEATNGLKDLRGTPKSKLIKSLFFLFKDEIVEVRFHLKSGETFGITFEDPDFEVR